MKKPDSLYYICHVNNLDSILSRGILARNQLGKLEPTGIHDADIVARRNEVVVSDDKRLSDYANLFFQPRNAMMYRLVCNEKQKELAILQINPAVLERPGVFLADRNAASSSANFYPNNKGLSKIDGGVFKKEYWTDSDDTKQRMMAEVLVPDIVPPSDIVAVYTARENVDVRAIADKHRIPYSKESKMFFFPEWRGRISNQISLSRGDMFFSRLQTFTISVNLVGIMGKGLASRTKYQFPDAYVRYQDDCKSRKLKVGKPTLFKRGIRIEEELADDASLLDPEYQNGARWFLFFPTKRHWREDSRFSDIELSMQWLLKNYESQKIQSLALPALGCGLGNLRWQDVGPMMCFYLKQMKIQSCIYLPMDAPLDDKFLTTEYLLSGYTPTFDLASPNGK